MKVNRFLVAFATLLFFFGSCKDEDSPVNKDVATEEITFSPEELRLLAEMENGSPKITEAEAMNKAIEIANSFSGLTKSGRAKTVKNSLALTIPKANGTKSSGEVADTVAYVFNFENEEGFAIVSADIRVPDQILAYTESGELGTYTDNPGLGLFLENAETYIAQSIEKAEAWKDSLTQEILSKLSVEELENILKAGRGDGSGDRGSYGTETVTRSIGPWESVSIVAPLLVVEWNQGNGNSDLYNKYTKSKGCNGNAPCVGCVAVATAQIMAYWGYPTSIDGYSMNWTEMTKYTHDYGRRILFYNKWRGYLSEADEAVKDNVARLMERIGVHVGMSYGCETSGANSDDAINWLKSLGFEGGEKSGYDFYRVKSSLDFRRIAYAEGYSLKVKNKLLGLITTSTTYKEGHAWNYDGYVQQKQRMETIVVSKSTGAIARGTQPVISYIYRDLVHVNWGWGGDKNGYYASGVFDATQDPVAFSDTKSSAEEGTTNNFQYLLSTYTNLRR
ncbi:MULTISPECIES: C10 family peptidase [unclassified Dysgonomonas]|uniref:C10 family peptidase n=1 Tax=unclassified Dysgonomonas TaxID=2630389 RepID=UPI0025C44046|nr:MULTISPECIES: C10 family peptidase [unclassified Dysgonomonas]HMM02754.1 C10 family peptidase [Dysgonomonas sp.]